MSGDELTNLSHVEKYGLSGRRAVDRRRLSETRAYNAFNAFSHMISGDLESNSLDAMIDPDAGVKSKRVLDQQRKPVSPCSSYFSASPLLH